MTLAKAGASVSSRANISTMRLSFTRPVLLPVIVLGAAVFTPQAAAAIGFMTAPQERGRAITFIFLGWSVASVLGMPMSAWLGETFGWRVAFLVGPALAVVILVVRSC